MIEPRKLRVVYRVEFDDREPVVFDLRLDEHGLLQNMAERGPSWTRIDDDGCRGCRAAGDHCRAALSIMPVVEAFLEVDSLQTTRTRVTIGERSTEVIGPISQVVASLMGLCMPASGCAVAAPFRAMAIYHQPFATLEETVIRAAGFTLLEHWAHGTLCGDDPFAALIDAWAGLEQINLRIGRKLQQYCEKDATLNGLTSLDMFAKSGGFGLDAALKALKPALLAAR